MITKRELKMTFNSLLLVDILYKINKEYKMRERNYAFDNS